MSQLILSLTGLLSAIVVEFLVYWAFIRKTPRTLFFFSVLINMLTLPLANFGYYYVIHNFLLIEGVVVAVESILIFVLLKQKYRTALLISIVANTITALMSFLF